MTPKSSQKTKEKRVKMPRPRELTRRLLVILPVALSALLAPLLVLPSTAGAYATIEGPPIYSTAPGLPDGRVYEQVSPANKNGNQAGASTERALKAEGHETRYATASADGDSVLFEGTGPIGETASPLSLFFVATRTSSGWKTRAVMPRPQKSITEFGGTLNSVPKYIYPSTDLSHVMLTPGGSYAKPAEAQCGLYLSDLDPFAPATCVTEGGVPVGGTPDFSTVDFTSASTLLPEDAPRAPHAGDAWGFYEDSEGTLRDVGVLPDGSLDPFGAVPAASGHGLATVGNQIASEGKRAFFVSPDPDSCIGVTIEGRKGENNCEADPPELYLRENGERTLLVSRDTLLPKVGELPAGAPAGVSPMLNSVDQPDGSNKNQPSYVFASPDGSRAFFQSEGQLTVEAPEGPPENTSPKAYDFDVETGSLTYLPNVVGQIVATDTNGSSFAFVRPETGGSPAELDLWSAGPAGGTVTPITQLPGPPASYANPFGFGAVYIPEARMSGDGSVLVFQTGTTLSPSFSSGGEEIYRYNAATNTVGCLSCAPPGAAPAGASMSQVVDHPDEVFGDPGLVDERGVSADGSRVFFETAAELVPQATNASPTAENPEGQLAKHDNVYEWENGVVYLISSGKSPNNSYFMDNSENGDDVFFATTDGLVPGDTDGAYDVYDARVPRPGDNPPPAAVPCEGAVCQGPPNVPSPLTPSASATFTGLGNSVAEPVTSTLSTVTKKTTKCKQGYVKKKGKCVKPTPTKKKAKSRKGGK
jgi:hypothetical protein